MGGMGGTGGAGVCDRTECVGLCDRMEGVGVCDRVDGEGVCDRTEGEGVDGREDDCTEADLMWTELNRDIGKCVEGLYGTGGVGDVDGGVGDVGDWWRGSG
jgi:hypothetical protein